MRNRFHHLRVFVCFALLTGLLVFTAVGCSTGGTPTATLTGKVLYKGSVVPGGTITFVTDKDVNKQTTFTCPIDGEGHYRVAGLPLDSTAKIGVNTSTAKGAGGIGAGNIPPEVLAKMKKDNPKLSGPSSTQPRYREINPKYVSPEKSGVTIKVTKANQEQDIELP
jgi:hypothetical protein